MTPSPVYLLKIWLDSFSGAKLIFLYEASPPWVRGVMWYTYRSTNLLWGPYLPSYQTYKGFG